MSGRAERPTVPAADATGAPESEAPQAEAAQSEAPQVPAPDVAALQAQLARMERQLAEIAAESRRSRERWEAIDELARDVTPLLRQAMNGATTTLDRLERRGYGEVLGASAEVADRIVQDFDREGVTMIGDNVLLLLKTIRGMR